MKRLAMILTVAVGLALAMPMVTLHAQDDVQKIVVLVNDTPITDYDIAQRVRLTSVTTRQQPTAAMRKKAVEELISENIQIQEARKFGVRASRKEVDAALETIGRRNNMTGPKLLAALGQLGVGPRTMRQKIEASIVWQRVVQGKFRHQVNIGHAQIDKVLSENAAEEGKETTVFQLRRVRLELPGSPNQKAIARRLVEAENLRQQVKSCDQIEAAIRRYSDASVKQLGRKTADKVVQPSRALLTAAKVGQLTPAYITASGVELYAVCGRRSVKSDDNQRKKVERQLAGQEFQILAQRYLRDLRQEAFVEYR